MRDPVETMKTAYATVNSMLTENESIDTYMSGTTAVLLLVLENEDRAVVANVGDSRVLLGRVDSKSGKWQAIQSRRPLRIFKGTLPYPGLVVTRSLGMQLRVGWVYSVNPRCFVLGTDGLWDGLDANEVISIVGNHKSPQSASKALTKNALAGMDAKSLDDNITNVVVFIERTGGLHL
ncbi:phosphatase 2C-like domain-containing protein [Chytridium lagenaria]|nr:phosphatase 2C-like domain-containing protein [Chytridium lagenaria]